MDDAVEVEKIRACIEHFISQINDAEAGICEFLLKNSTVLGIQGSV